MLDWIKEFSSYSCCRLACKPGRHSIPAFCKKLKRLYLEGELHSLVLSKQGFVGNDCKAFKTRHIGRAMDCFVGGGNFAVAVLVTRYEFVSEFLSPT